VTPGMTHTPLEPDLAALIEPHTGPIVQAARTPRGFTFDLPAVARAIERISTTTLPPVARDWRESRHDRYAAGKEGLFAGYALLHGDINPDNWFPKAIASYGSPLMEPGSCSVMWSARSG
jgi:hypothetical protein